jgi:MATE family multidrug resistance protein
MAGVSTISLSILLMMLPTGLFLLLPDAIASFYTEDSQVMHMASSLLLFAGLFQIADAAQLSSISMLRSLNDIKWPTFLSFLAFWVLGLPIGYWLAVHQGWNAKGVWVGYLVALTVQAGLFMYRFFDLTRKIR